MQSAMQSLKARYEAIAAELKTWRCEFTRYGHDWNSAGCYRICTTCGYGEIRLRGRWLSAKRHAPVRST